MSARLRFLALPLAGLLSSPVMTALAEQPPAPPKFACAEMEAFLHEAKIGPLKAIPRGVTLPQRATLDSGTLQHDASIQTIDEKRASYQTQRGTELNFRDYWGFNVAGFELAKLLGLNMVPPYVERKVGGKSASLSWWVNDTMLELDRSRKKISPPDSQDWARQMYLIRVFNQLIHNTDPNLGNFLIDKNWQVWMIDFTRAFRASKDLLNPGDLVQCDRKLLAALRELNKDMLQQHLGKYLNGMEIDGLLARRDKIVKFFDAEIAKKGEAAVLFELPRAGQPCGAGL